MNAEADTLLTIKKAIRAKYAWPGGYPLFFVTHDGAAISTDGARQVWRDIVSAHLTKHRSGGFYIDAIAVNWEDTDLTCAITDAPIESAYGGD